MARELDLEIAERVMGWRWVTGPHWDVSGWQGDQRWLLPDGTAIADIPPGEWTYYDSDAQEPDGRYTLYAVPQFSSDMGDAWRVVTRILDTDGPYAKWNMSFGMEYSRIIDWTVDFTPRRNHPNARDYDVMRVEGTSAPETICRAALRVVESLAR